jgi:ATP synthase protein I
MSDLSDLDKKIKTARQKEMVEAEAVKQAQQSDSRAGIQVGVELVGAIVVCTAIGYGLDSWLGTKPLFLILLFFIGVFVGFYNVYRISQNLGSAVGYSRLHQTEKNAKSAADLEKNNVEHLHKKS